MPQEPIAQENWDPVFESFIPRRRFALDSPAQRRRGTCVTVASQKGGVGKTTTSINLAAGFGLAGRKALLFDFDPQANATSGVGQKKIAAATGARPRRRSERARTPRGWSYLDGIDREDFFLSSIRETEYENLWVLPSFEDLSDIEMIQRLQSTKFDLWKLRVEALRGIFDVVFIDCPPSLGGIPTLALTVSDRVIIPVQCEYYAMEGLSQILPVIESLQQEKSDTLEVSGLLLTMYSHELDLARDVVGEIEEYFPDLVYRSIIPRDVTLAESASHGLPIYYYSPLSCGAWSYLDLTREVLSHES